MVFKVKYLVVIIFNCFLLCGHYLNSSREYVVQLQVALILKDSQLLDGGFGEVCSPCIHRHPAQLQLILIIIVGGQTSNFA